MQDFKMTFDANRGMHAVENREYTREDTVFCIDPWLGLVKGFYLWSCDLEFENLLAPTNVVNQFHVYNQWADKTGQVMITEILYFAK